MGFARAGTLALAAAVGLGTATATTPAFAAENAAIAKGGEAAALADLRSGLADMIAQDLIPNAQVAIVKDGKEVTRFTLGQMDRENGIPLREDAIFRLYSMTKPITSVAAMMLVEEGRLAIEAPVERYIPEFSDLRVYESGGLEDMVTVPANRPITIGDLLTHSSGITYNFMGNTPVHQYYRRNGVMRSGGVGQGPDDAAPAVTMDELIARLAKAPLLHQPGERFSYSNSTGVLGVVVERASGMRLDRFLVERIFAPLGMRDTAFVVDDSRIGRLVNNYSAAAGGMEIIETAEQSEYRDPSRMFDGGGALAGTLDDYLRFAQMLANRGTLDGHQLLRPETVDAMFTPRLATGGAAHEDVLFGYGLGIGDAASEARGGMPAGAGGWSGSANTYFFVQPRHNLVAVLMTNELIGPEFTERTIQLRGLLDRAAAQVIRQSEPALP